MANTQGPQIHPLYAQDRFPSHIKYELAFHDAVVLATRIMDSPQALQHDYCVFFGTNGPIRLPRRIRHKLGSTAPTQYTSDKGVGELDDRDIQAVLDERIKLSKRIRYEIDTTYRGICGLCQCQPRVAGIRGRDSLITIETTLYQAAKDKDRTPEENARMTLMLALVLLHEVAHAAHNHLFGIKYESFRETSICAEAGRELESRIFGAIPCFLEHSLSNFTWDNWLSRCTWTSWQHWGFKIPRGQRHMMSRRRDLHPARGTHFRVDDAFIRKLCDDNFWSGEYVRRGAESLVPDEIAKVCRAERDTYSQDPNDILANLRIPLSIRDLFRSGGPSYAQSKYSDFTNANLVLRNDQISSVSLATTRTVTAGGTAMTRLRVVRKGKRLTSKRKKVVWKRMAVTLKRMA
jgi:hypothetical protein